MWGDPEKAASLQENDFLASLLYQISSPAHIPWGDQRWQELLHGYDVWVHVDDSNELVQRACENMAKHAEMSSNLAALCLHVTRMIRELVRDVWVEQVSEETSDTRSTSTPATAGIASNGSTTNTLLDKQVAVMDFSKRISRVAKGRATAGALLLLQLLSHEAIVVNSKRPQTSADNLQDIFTYHTRGDLPTDQPAAAPLLHSILDLITAVGKNENALKTPEIYDSVVFAFQLLLVLCGSQLYNPFQSSFESRAPFYGLLGEIFRYDDTGNTIEDDNNLQSLWMSSRSSMTIPGRSATTHTSRPNGKGSGKRNIWTPKSVLEVCLEWQIRRPPAPERSLSHYYFILAQAAVSQQGGEKLGQDGMYESHMVVQATAPVRSTNVNGDPNDCESEFSGIGDGSGENTVALTPRRLSESHSILLDATKGVLTLGGKIILLPFRLVSLVVGVLVANKKGSQQLRQGEMIKKFASAKSSRTRDVLWLSNSIVSDLASSLFLLLANNKRSGEYDNPFRVQLSGLTDNRWDEEDDSLALPDLPSLNTNTAENFEGHDSFRVEDLTKSRQHGSTTSAASVEIHPLTLNFESLFLSFGKTLHTEPAALLLYTLLQASPSFAESLAVRSDLDTLVMPLLRTLYFASRSHTFFAKDYVSKRASITSTTSHGTSTSPVVDIRSCPFRSLSQLYVIIILLLLFSQDSSFGRDAFKRNTVPNVVWYKERHLKNINLGSIILLTLLRSLLFNLNRLHDVFLLNNCCAVLMNLSPSVLGLHEYASMRLASVAITVMKKHAKLAASVDQVGRKPGTSDLEEDDSNSPLGMHEEVVHTILALLKQSLSPLSLGENLHLIYALVYHQMDLVKLCKNKNLYPSKETERIVSVTLKAASLIQEEGARTAPKALKVLESRVDILVEAVNAADAKSKSKRRKHATNASAEDDCTFTYEEEADPEIFFVPYVWELIVCCTTSTSISWRKNDICAFALLEEVDDHVGTHGIDFEGLDVSTTTGFANADEMV